VLLVLVAIAFGLLVWYELRPEDNPAWPPISQQPEAVSAPVAILPPRVQDSADADHILESEGTAPETRATPAGTAEPDSVMTRVVLPRIGLDAEVVPSPLSLTSNGPTWLIPPFRAGHLEGTAGAGQIGNGVLMGHVTSRSAGNVFQDLDQAREGDEVLIYGASAMFHYRVVSVQSVPREAVEVLQPQGDEAAVSMITCSGLWNPIIWDYMERLVVRADLVGLLSLTGASL